MTHHPEHDPLGDLTDAGVAVADDLSRELLAGGGLRSLVADRHVVGVTTNPTIFASALSKGDRYNDQLAELADPRRGRRHRGVRGDHRRRPRRVRRPCASVRADRRPGRLRVHRGRPAAEP